MHDLVIGLFINRDEFGRLIEHGINSSETPSARDHDGLVFLEPQQAKKLLGRLDIPYHNGDVVEVC
jgi:hypothetical protein